MFSGGRAWIDREGKLTAAAHLRLFVHPRSRSMLASSPARWQWQSASESPPQSSFFWHWGRSRPSAGPALRAKPPGTLPSPPPRRAEAPGGGSADELELFTALGSSQRMSLQVQAWHLTHYGEERSPYHPSVRERDAVGRTPLHYAAMGEGAARVSFLIRMHKGRSNR